MIVRHDLVSCGNVSGLCCGLAAAGLDEIRGRLPIIRTSSRLGVFFSGSADPGPTGYAIVDDPARFTKSKAVGPALGLTPSRYQSGETDRRGANTKAGDARARVALFKAAHVIMTCVARWFPSRGWPMPVAARRGAKRAEIALARKLALILHRMRVDGTDFQAQLA